MLAKLNTHTPQRAMLWFVIALYSVEFLDELIYGMVGAVLPHLKTDLALTYTQVGMLFTIPGLIAMMAEPIIGLLGDTRYRRALVLGGIASTTLGLFLVGSGHTFLVVLLAFTMMASASGAYVNLAQATLIDLNPSRSEQTMARWVLLGYIGVAAAPLIATAAFYLGYGWRGLYLALAGVAGLYTAMLLRQRFDAHAGANEESASPRRLAQLLMAGLRNSELLKWMLLTEMADLMLDKFLEVTGLYFADVVGVGLNAASGAVAVATTVGLVGSVALVPILERVRGLRLLRVTAAIVMIAYVAFLLLPFVWLKYLLLGLISFCAAPWYPALHAKSYDALPGQSGLVMAVGALANITSLFVPVVIGRIADVVGLQWAMWLLALGPVALIVGLPCGNNGVGPDGRS
ncbi:MAG: MFS transporter [Chloroflexi bacterium]|nr:MFS transporter [Chloroflexota bacterium]